MKSKVHPRLYAALWIIFSFFPNAYAAPDSTTTHTYEIREWPLNEYRGQVTMTFKQDGTGAWRTPGGASGSLTQQDNGCWVVALWSQYRDHPAAKLYEEGPAGLSVDFADPPHGAGGYYDLWEIYERSTGKRAQSDALRAAVPNDPRNPFDQIPPLL